MNGAALSPRHLDGAVRHSQFRVAMDTAVTIDLWSPRGDKEVNAAMDRGFGWFDHLEGLCSRFDPASELSRLGATVSQAVPISAPLMAALRFALAVATATDGAFDPTVGDAMASRGFNLNYRTGLSLARQPERPAATFRDVQVDELHQSVTLLRPLSLDLGAVAKGLALDLAARELAGHGPCVVGAGGDFLFRGASSTTPWLVDVRHPFEGCPPLATIRVHDGAVCTSGAYERSQPAGGHLLDPRTGGAVTGVLSATVIAPHAVLADALATAAFVMGRDGLDLIALQGADALLLLEDMTTLQTPRFDRWLA